MTVGWDLKAFVWQKDQLVTQLHWQENGPTFSNTPYRYQACRCEDPGGGLDLGVEGEWEEIWGKLVAVASITSGLSSAQEGTELLRRAGQAPGAEQLLTGPQVWAGSRPAWGATALHSADSPQASAPAPTLLPHRLGWLYLLASPDQTLWP